MYQRIPVPVDGSVTSNAGLAEAIKLAKLTGARMLLLHVVDEMAFLATAGGYGVVTGDVFSILRSAGEDTLTEARLRAEAEGVAVDAALFDTLNGRLYDRVNEQVETWKADLLVLGTHGRHGVSRLLLGSDAERIVRTATVPVLLIRGPRSAEAAPPDDR